MSKPTRRKILVVDDDAISLEVTRERLQEAGFLVVTHSNALGTSVLIAREKPDFVLLDVRMPGLSGDRLAKLLSKANFRPRVILHSACERAELNILSMLCGAAGVIEKTDDDQYFLKQLENCIGVGKLVQGVS
jgi:two-component system NtrC family response regulator